MTPASANRLVPRRSSQHATCVAPSRFGGDPRSVSERHGSVAVNAQRITVGSLIKWRIAAASGGPARALPRNALRRPWSSCMQMRQLVTIASSGIFGAGCSWILNPSNIAPPRADSNLLDSVDAPEITVDADPMHPTIARVDPASIIEGQGDDPGSRQALLVINGANFVSGVMVSVAATNPSDNAKIIV